MKPGQFVRHGDVIFIRVEDSDVPKDVTRADHDHPADNQAVAAYGEVTGHRHLITGAEGASVNLFEVPGLKNATDLKSGRLGNTGADGLIADRFLVVEASDEVKDAEAAATITHEEHDTIKLPAGTYKVRIQKEYAPGAVRNVSD